MRPGDIDVNIMTKLDRTNVDQSGQPLSEEFSDAKAALRGYASSSLQSAVEFSAGLNQRLFNYLAQFRDFYRTESGDLKKKIVLKVSDFRSAVVQGKILAKKGLEVHEFRIESGLNCGGHAFASNGYLLPSLLKEFNDKRDQLKAEFQPLIQKFYTTMGWKYPDAAANEQPIVTVQGGIGTSGEDRRLREQFGMDRTGWGTPFLLVPEATCVDDATRRILQCATEEDVYLSEISPLGIPFNNVHGTGSELATRKRVEEGRAGSSCPRGFLVSNTEFTEELICTASTQYQTAKLAQVESMDVSRQEKERLVEGVVAKACICEHLGNGALISLGVAEPSKAPQAISPGPNIAWFDRFYSLIEMVDHIYGRGKSLVPPHRPHMFAQEIILYVDYFKRLVANCTYSQREVSTLREFKENLEKGMAFCLDLADQERYGDENLSSIPPCVREQQSRLREIGILFEQTVAEMAAESLVIA
jgi:NAD(P)H-dependent flavin oxidoreductase YrpB (nitropropane dioxygenase family)